MSADWFIKKKEQLRQMGSHPVPGTKRREEVRRSGRKRKKLCSRKGEKLCLRNMKLQDLVAASDGLLVMKDVVVEGLQVGDGVGDKPPGPGGPLGVQPAGPEGEDGNQHLVAEDAKKKTPLQYWLEQPTSMTEEKISNFNKQKKFKESRLEKRQVKYRKAQNFLEDNIHQGGERGAKTEGKLMTFGRGALKDLKTHTF